MIISDIIKCLQTLEKQGYGNKEIQTKPFNPSLKDNEKMTLILAENIYYDKNDNKIYFKYHSMIYNK